jgi:hypothetical protein
MPVRRMLYYRRTPLENQICFCSVLFHPAFVFADPRPPPVIHAGSFLFAVLLADILADFFVLVLPFFGLQFVLLYQQAAFFAVGKRGLAGPCQLP